MIKEQKIKEGVYLVVDPQMQKTVLINKLKQIMDKSEIAAVQVLNHQPGGSGGGSSVARLKVG